MFRRRNMGERSFGRTNPTFESTSFKDQEDWIPIEHFVYTYTHFIDFSEEMNQEETAKLASAVTSWFPEEVLINSTINMETVGKTIGDFRSNHNGDKDEVFNNSLIFIKDWFENNPEKLEIMLDEIWEIIADDNKLSSREKQLFLMVSKAFNIQVDLE